MNGVRGGKIKKEEEREGEKNVKSGRKGEWKGWWIISKRREKKG